MAIVSVSAFANNPVSKEPVAINQQFYKFLKGVETGVDESTLVYIDFMVNEKGEIMVLSTNNKFLDSVLKSRLNYKTLETGDLEYFKKYTIPVRIEKI